MYPRICCMLGQTSCCIEAGMTSSGNLVARLVGCAQWDRHALPHGLLVWQGQSTSPVTKSLLSVTPSFVQWLACPQSWGAGHSALVFWGTACWFWCLVTTIHRPSLCALTCLASAGASPGVHGTRFLRAQPSSCIDVSPPFISDASVQSLAWPQLWWTTGPRSLDFKGPSPLVSLQSCCCLLPTPQC